MSYFEYSQQLRREIESEESIVTRLKYAFRGDIEPFAFGGTVNIFCIGQTKSGIWTALRAFRPKMPEGMRTTEIQKSNMEIYCQNVEYLHEKGERCPALCIGVVYENMVGILTEDLSAGGKYEIEHNPDLNYGFILSSENRQKVFIDLDYGFRIPPNRREKYFAEDAFILLE